MNVQLTKELAECILQKHASIKDMYIEDLRVLMMFEGIKTIAFCTSSFYDEDAEESFFRLDYITPINTLTRKNAYVFIVNKALFTYYVTRSASVASLKQYKDHIPEEHFNFLLGYELDKLRPRYKSDEYLMTTFLEQFASVILEPDVMGFIHLDEDNELVIDKEYR